MNVMKKMVALLATVVITMTLFVGCARTYEATFKPDDVVLVVGGKEVKANLVNFHVRYNQSLMESVYGSYMGESVWTMEVEDGVTYEENLKKSLMEELQEMYVVVNHAADYDVALTDEETASIEAAAESFLEENTDADALDKVSGDKETVIEYLTLLTLKERMATAMRADIDTNVTDEEAAQKKARYFEIKKTTELDDGSTMELSDDEIKAAKKEAKEFLKAAKENGSMEAYATESGETTKTLTFDADSTTLDKEVIKAADALAENEFSEVIESDTGFYVLQLESMFDQSATEMEKETILTKRQEARYEELVEKWTKEAKIKVYDEVWDKISIEALKVVYTQDKTEESEDKTEE